MILDGIGIGHHSSATKRHSSAGRMEGGMARAYLLGSSGEVVHSGPNSG